MVTGEPEQEMGFSPSLATYYLCNGQAIFFSFFVNFILYASHFTL